MRLKLPSVVLIGTSSIQNHLGGGKKVLLSEFSPFDLRSNAKPKPFPLQAPSATKSCS